MRYIVTGSAGFIGFHVAQRLLNDGHTVRGIDSYTTYYDVALKHARSAILNMYSGFSESKIDLVDRESTEKVFLDVRPDVVIHLAAQAGVRYSLENPAAYMASNLMGTFHVLEASRLVRPSHLLLASTSSVYGSNESMPFAESERTDFPISLYAATKRGAESLTHAYAHLYDLPTTCFRFFTVYGPHGRPDMAPDKFLKKILSGSPIDVYGDGSSMRDYTYIDDLVESVIRLTSCVPKTGVAKSSLDSISNSAPWRTVNIGGGSPITLREFIETCERAVSKEAVRNPMPRQPGDVQITHADARLLLDLTEFAPRTSLQEGITRLARWLMRSELEGTV